MVFTNLVDKVFKDKNNNFVFFQFPNVWIFGWLIGSVFSRISRGELQTFSSNVAFVSLLIWAGLEVFAGSTIFRRILGSVVLVFMVYNRF